MAEEEHFDSPNRIAAREAYRAEADRRRYVEQRADVASAAADSQRLSGREITTNTRYFLPPEVRAASSGIIPAGTSAYQVPNPRPGPDPQQARLANAAIARAVEQAGRLSGSHTQTTSAASW